jgi:predicted DNA-binding protein
MCKHCGVPNQPKTPLRAFRIPDEIYDVLKAKAADEGRTVTDVVREAFREYIQRHNLS